MMFKLSELADFGKKRDIHFYSHYTEWRESIVQKEGYSTPNFVQGQLNMSFLPVKSFLLFAFVARHYTTKYLCSELSLSYRYAFICWPMARYICWCCIFRPFSAQYLENCLEIISDSMSILYAFLCQYLVLKFLISKI